MFQHENLHAIQELEASNRFSNATTVEMDLSDNSSRQSLHPFERSLEMSERQIKLIIQYMIHE